MGINNLNVVKHEYVASQLAGWRDQNWDAPVTASPANDLNISGFVRILKQQWLLIAAMVILSLFMASAYVMTATTKYTASSKILINPQPKRVFGSDYIPQDGNTNQILIESQTKVIASNSVLERVVASQNLIADPEFSDAARRGMPGWLASSPVEITATKERQREALRRLQEKLTVKRPSQTYVVEVAVSSQDADKAARLSRAVVTAYITDQAETQAHSTRQVSKLLQARLTDLRANVLDADTKVQIFRQKHNIIATEGALVNERHLSRLNDELLAARNRMTESGARAGKLRGMIRRGVLPDNFDEAIKSRLITSLREQYANVARRESQLASVYGNRHPQLIKARARLVRSKRLINAELRRIAGSLQAEHEVEKKRVASLEKRLDRSRGVTDLTNKARVELASLERDANASRAVYERLLAKAREANAKEKINLLEARIISYASPPLWASWPKKKIIFPLALLLGLGLGLAGALLNDARQDHFISNSEVEMMTGLATFGAIPSPQGERVSLTEKLFGGRDIRAANQSSYYRLYVELAKVGSPFATAALGLVRNLVKLKASQHSHSVMMVSSRADEGSSSIAWSAAISAAMQNHNVLLVDGDGGNGDLAQTLAPQNKGVLRKVLAGQAPLSSLIVEDQSLGLSFLPIVTPRSRESGVNWSDYRTLLAQLPDIAADYDLVIVDGGAILDSGLAHLLVDVVDDVALVVRKNGVSRNDVHEAMQSLAPPAGKMCGVIVSAIDPQSV